MRTARIGGLVAVPLLLTAQAGASAGLAAGSPDGDYSLRIGGDAQFRYTATVRPNSPDDEDKSFTHGFAMNILRPAVHGHLISQNLRYSVMGGFNRANGNFTLIDAFVDYTIPDTPFAVRVGQFRPGFLRELDVGPQFQLAAERSTTHAVFTTGWTQGVEGRYQEDRWRVRGGVFSGVGSINTDWFQEGQADIALHSRAEYIVLGDPDWSRFNQFTSWRGTPLTVMVGLGGMYQHEGDTGRLPLDGGPSDTPRADEARYTVDVSVLGDGWNAFGAIVGTVRDESGSSTVYDLGVLAQGGMFVDDHNEPFVRYDVVAPDGDRPGGSTAFHTMTAGWNYYVLPKSHAAKFTADVQFMPTRQSDSDSLIGAPSGNLGILPSSRRGQTAVRAQFQVIF